MGNDGGDSSVTYLDEQFAFWLSQRAGEEGLEGGGQGSKNMALGRPAGLAGCCAAAWQGVSLPKWPFACRVAAKAVALHGLRGARKAKGLGGAPSQIVFPGATVHHHAPSK